MISMDVISLLLDVAIGAAAFRLAWSVDRTQKEMLKIQAQQAQILTELTSRVEKLEDKLDD